MRFQKITDAEVREVHKRYTAGVTARDLAAEFGMSGWALRYRFRRLGLSIWPSYRPAKTGRVVSGASA